MSRLILYSKNGCPFCALLKHELLLRRITYTEFDLSDDDLRQQFYAESQTKSVPQVYLTDDEATQTRPSGDPLGGWDMVSKLLDSLGERIGVAG